MSNNAHIINIGGQAIDAPSGVVSGGFNWYETKDSIRALTSYFDEFQAGSFENSAVYEFDSASTAVDDDDLVLQPDNITIGPGRYHKRLSLSQSSGLIASLQQALVVKGVTIGSVAPEDVFPINTQLETVLREMLIAQILPTFVNPTIALAVRNYSDLVEVTVMEAGTVIDLSLLATFVQHDAGALTSFSYKRATTVIQSTLSTPWRYTPGGVIGNETLQFSVQAFYGAGTAKLDNLGNPIVNPIGAGSITSALKTLRGVLKAFFGTGDVVTSANVRALAGSLLDVANGSTFTITVPQGQTIITFAYPATLPNPDSVLYQEGFNVNLVSQGIFTAPTKTINVLDATGVNSYSYKIFQQTLPAPYSNDVHYIVNI